MNDDTGTVPGGDGSAARARPAEQAQPSTFGGAPSHTKGSMLRAVLAVLFGWLLLSVPVGLFTLLALLAGVDCGPECGGESSTIVPVLFTGAALTLIVAPVLAGWSVRRPWSPAWKIGVGTALPSLVVFVVLAAGGI